MVVMIYNMILFLGYVFFDANVYLTWCYILQFISLWKNKLHLMQQIEINMQKRILFQLSCLLLFKQTQLANKRSSHKYETAMHDSL